MEKMIKSYETYIKSELAALKKSPNKTTQDSLFRLHTATIHNFQHERLVHLLIMILFVVLSVAFIFLYSHALLTSLIPSFTEPFFYLATLTLLLLVGLTAAYIKHYYFLENHIQALYKYFKDLA